MSPLVLERVFPTLNLANLPVPEPVYNLLLSALPTPAALLWSLKVSGFVSLFSSLSPYSSSIFNLIPSTLLSSLFLTDLSQESSSKSPLFLKYPFNMLFNHLYILTRQHSLLLVSIIYWHCSYDHLPFPNINWICLYFWSWLSFPPIK